MALWRPEEVEELLAGGDEIVRLARQRTTWTGCSFGHVWRVHALLTLGDIESVEREVTLTAGLARSSGSRSIVGSCSTGCAMLALLRGRFEEAERLALEAFEIGQRWSRPTRRRHMRSRC